LNKIKVETVNGGYVEIVQHSVNQAGEELLTVNTKYGLIVHAEWLRHRQLSRGVKSNRAIPCKVIRKEVLEDPYVPVWFGANKSGMVSQVEVKHKKLCTNLWKAARYPTIAVHWTLEKLGLHKEVNNRLLNPWQWVRETVTASEWDNFFNLRCHSDAQRDIKIVADALLEAKSLSTPMFINAGEWHTPYVDRKRVDGKMKYYDTDGTELTPEQAIKASAARCARSSYDKHDGSKPTLKGDLPLYEMLIESNPKHASPVEHQGTPIPTFISNWKDIEGITHEDRKGQLWSGNFKGFIQYRQLLNNHTCNNYKEGV